MSSQLITAPDLVDDDNLSILIINPSATLLDIIVASCRNLDRDFNIYVGRSVEDQEWISSVLVKVDKIFKNPTVEEIYQFLQTKDAELNED